MELTDREGVMKQSRLIAITAIAGLVSACASTEVTRTSINTAAISTSAAPACGAQGAAHVAAKMAAVETIKDGFDRYIITGGMANNNVGVYQTPGTYHTYGVASYGNGYGTYSGTTTYTPGAAIVYGSHDQSMTIVMFHAGDPGYESAIDARQVLGPKWEDQVKRGIHTCT